ncbi:PREDICTED: AH receptor-interacting protein [Drosophila arizonae]|uniref:AH receptor-interacting protein n=1 Tax=Drosophila arizonae TaxID=7263 RepID=A0ABM1PY28_DROAR|nr:PREDICTED: AH receptor-interacting protein [Drosophila arizonae]
MDKELKEQVNLKPIRKEIISPGNKYIELKPGTRVKFHFQTRRANDVRIIDDSKKINKPMELVLGKKFKLEVWEVMVQKMSLNEVAKFTVHKSLCAQYPFISKTLRDIGKKPDERRHCCGMTLQNEGMGYEDLDELLQRPVDLEFTIELISIELPEEYEKERWQMSDDEKMLATHTLRERGNRLYNAQNYAEAEICYRDAVGMVEQLMLKEKPHDAEWQELANIKVPLLLNYAQCRLIAGDYYAVIEHCNEVLTLDPRNVKALFRRAKAHAGAWNPAQARRDFLDALSLDASLKTTVARELKAIEEQQHERNVQDRIHMQKLF